MEINEDEYKSIIKILAMHTELINELSKDNEVMKCAIQELCTALFKDRLIFSSTIASTVNILKEKHIFDTNEFSQILNETTKKDLKTYSKEILESYGINADVIFNNDNKKSSKINKKPKAKDGVINFSDYK